MQIGTFTKSGENGYSGELRSLLLSISEASITPVVAKTASGPDFVIIATRYGIGDDNYEYEIGTAWERTSRAGKKYLSVKLDCPTLAAPIHCALINQHEHYALVWNRTSTKEEAEPVPNPEGVGS